MAIDPQRAYPIPKPCTNPAATQYGGSNQSTGKLMKKMLIQHWNNILCLLGMGWIPVPFLRVTLCTHMNTEGVTFRNVAYRKVESMVTLTIFKFVVQRNVRMAVNSHLKTTSVLKPHIYSASMNTIHTYSRKFQYTDLVDFSIRTIYFGPKDHCCFKI